MGVILPKKNHKNGVILQKKDHKNEVITQGNAPCRSDDLCPVLRHTRH